MSSVQFCTDLGISLVHDLEQFFEHELDMVMVTSEIWQHREHVLKSLEHNCHVFVGKPLSYDVEDVLTIMSAAKTRDLLVLPGQPLRYEQGLNAMASKIQAGEIGEVTNIRLFINHAPTKKQTWQLDPEKSGGPLGIFGIYLFDLVRWIADSEFSEIFALGENVGFHRCHSYYDTIMGVGRLESGALVSLNLVSTITWPYPFVILEVVGKEGVARTNYDNYELIVQGKSGTSLGDLRLSPMGENEICHFVECCLGRVEPRIDLDDMLMAAKGIAAMQESIRTGKVIETR